VLALTSAACGGGGGSDRTSKNATELAGTLTVRLRIQPEPLVRRLRVDHLGRER
jgi:hypothetical protein